MVFHGMIAMISFGRRGDPIRISQKKMNRRLTRNPVIKVFQEVLEKDQEVQFAYLYGSVAIGAQTPQSDIDVAVCLKPTTMKNFMRTEEELTFTLIKRLHNDRLDLRVMNVLPLLMQYRVLKEGILIFSRNEFDRVDFETQVMIRFFKGCTFGRKNSIFTNLTRANLIRSSCIPDFLITRRHLTP